MKKQIFKLLLFGILISTLLFACKKEDVTPNRIAGTYIANEIEDYKTNKIEPSPNASGQSVKITVNLTNSEKNADLKFYIIENGKETLVASFNFIVSKDADGDYSLLDQTDNNKLMAFFIDNEADFYFATGYRISAKKQ
ncbi:hypothetical protein [Pedobacter yonginense]|nr:hypothetical protein [Pedobacter yonginense]